MYRTGLYYSEKYLAICPDCWFPRQPAVVKTHLPCDMNHREICLKAVEKKINSPQKSNPLGVAAHAAGYNCVYQSFGSSSSINCSSIIVLRTLIFQYCVLMAFTRGISKTTFTCGGPLCPPPARRPGASLTFLAQEGGVETEVVDAEVEPALAGHPALPAAA